MDLAHAGQQRGSALGIRGREVRDLEAVAGIILGCESADALADEAGFVADGDDGGDEGLLRRGRGTGAGGRSSFGGHLTAANLIA